MDENEESKVDIKIGDGGSVWEGAGCFVLCLALAILIAGGTVITIIEAIKK